MDADVEKAVAQSAIDLQDTETAFSYRSTEELRFSLFIFNMFKQPWLVGFLSNLTLFAIRVRLPVSWIIKKTIFRQFCGGVSMQDCDSTIEKLGKAKVGSILDYAVEGAEEEKDFDRTRDELISILKKSRGNPDIPFGCLKMTGLAKFSILQKLTEGKELTSIEREKHLKAVRRLEDICRTAVECDTRMFIDAEETWVQDAIDQVAESMMAKFNKEKPVIYTTLQMYRHDRIDYLEKLLNQSQTQGFYIGIKYVRGAYLEKENGRAAEKGYPTPMQSSKAKTDHDYNLALKLSLEHLERLAICAGTHNETSCLYLVELMKGHGLPKDHPHIHFSQLFGMSDNISFVLGKEGYNVTKYLPYGPVRFAIPYLIRRAQENTSVSGQTSKELQLIQRELTRRKKASQ